MGELLESLQQHLDSLAEPVPPPSPVGRPDLDIPAFLKRGYELLSGRALGQAVTFALRRKDPGGGDAERLLKDHVLLTAALGESYLVFVLGSLTPHVRRRLIAASVPFIVPGSQVFLPALHVDLRERQPGPVVEPAGPLAWSTQLVLLRHLLHGDVEERNLAGVAELSGYTPMAISQAQRQLVGAKLARLHKVGRSKHLAFAAAGRELWDLALPRLRSPVQRLWPVAVRGQRPGGLRAGLKALAERTMIQAGQLPTIALAAPRVRAALEAGALEPRPSLAEAELAVEAWAYDPTKLSSSDQVDSLSLFLSLQDRADERVEEALDELLEELPW